MIILYVLSRSNNENVIFIFQAEEIIDFNQSDLSEDDVMVLDTWDSIFIWVGVNSTREEVVKAEKLVAEYLKSDPTGRDLDMPIMKIHQGCEPPTFIGFFGVWDPDSWEVRSCASSNSNKAINSVLKSYAEPNEFREDERETSRRKSYYDDCPIGQRNK